MQQEAALLPNTLWGMIWRYQILKQKLVELQSSSSASTVGDVCFFFSFVALRF
jgi:hypothetical protein